MILKVGLLVLCQFYWSGANLKQDEGKAPPALQEMVGTIKMIYPHKQFKTVTKNGKVFALTDEKTILEIQGQRPDNTYFIAASSCVPVSKQEEVDAEDEKEKLRKKPLRSKEAKQENQKDKNDVEKVISTVGKLDFKNGPVSKTLEKIDSDTTLVEKKVEPKSKSDSLNIGLGTQEPKKELAVPKQELKIEAPIKEEKKEDLSPPEPPKEDKKNEKESVVKGMIKDLFNQ